MRAKLFEFGSVNLKELTPQAALKHVLLPRVPAEQLYARIAELPDDEPITWKTISQLAA